MMVGKRIKKIATIPYIPTDDLRSPIEEEIVAAASAKAVPVRGTAVPTINFAVLVATVSAAEFTAVCTPKIPIKTVEINENPHKAIFLIAEATEERGISGEMLEVIDKERNPPIKGIIKKEDITETPSVAASKKEPDEVAVATFPESVTIATKIGTNANINVEQPFIELAAADIVEKAE